MSRQPTRTPRVQARGVGRLLLFLAVVLGAFIPMPASRASSTICVALVVDFTPLNGGVDSGCTRVPKGANGYDVLHAGGHTFQICSNGIIGTIDGQPANGCQIKDDTHFWGYWHRAPGSRTWTFSSYGAGGYHPVEGSTEGWVWENGKTTPPANTAYPAGCHTPPASATPAPKPSPRSSSPSGNSQISTQGGATARDRASSRPGSPATRSGHPKRTRHRASPSARPAQRSSPPPTAVSPQPTPSSTTGVLAATPPDTHDQGGGPTAPLAAGLGVAALVGGGAWWRSHRSGVDT